MGSSTTTRKGAHEIDEVDIERLASRLKEAQDEIAKLQRELSEARVQTRRMASTFERAPFAIFVKDLEGRYLDANPMAATVLGRSLDDLIGTSDEDLFGPAAALEIRDIDQYVITTNRPFRYEARRMTESGEQVYQTTKWPWMSESGVSVGIIAMSRNITSQKNAEEYFTLHDAISRCLAQPDAISSLMESLLEPIRGTFGADAAFLWSRRSEARLELSGHRVARPGFGESLIEESSKSPIHRGEGHLGRSWSENAPVVIPPGDDPRGRIASESGIRTILTIPIVTRTSVDVFEILTPEKRTAAPRFIETLGDAARRLADFRMAHDAEAPGD